MWVVLTLGVLATCSLMCSLSARGGPPLLGVLTGVLLPQVWLREPGFMNELSLMPFTRLSAPFSDTSAAAVLTPGHTQVL